MKNKKNSTGIFKIMLMLFGIAVIFSLGLNTTAAANTSIYVSTHGNNSWDGLNPIWNGTSGPKATINNATGTVKSNGTVHIASGTYKENKININKNMNIIGANQKNTIIYGTNTGTIFNIASGIKVTIINLKLTNGTTSNGGAIQNNGILNIKNSTFTNNKATMGGAIYNIGTLTVSDCNFTSNNGTYGGAVYNDNYMTVLNSIFTSNIASDSGGGIYNYYTNNNKGILTVTGTTFTGNKAIYGGAIIAISHFGTVNVTGSIFKSNLATWGGAIYNGDTLHVKSSTFTGNTATNCGGALYNEGKANLQFNQIIKNTAKNQGSAIYNDLGTANLSLNWWGTNTNPSKNVYGTNIQKWLVLSIKANPKTIPNNGISTITTDLLHNNLGTLETGHVPNGITVNFATTLGTIINKASIINGVAKATLKSGPSHGIATISAKSDSQTVKTSVKIRDTIAPKVSSTTPKNLSTATSRTGTIIIKFSENIKASNYYKNIKVKNISTGKYVTITKTISGNTLSIKTGKKGASNWYLIIIPKAAIKDLAGNNLVTSYNFKFKTRN